MHVEEKRRADFDQGIRIMDKIDRYIATIREIEIRIGKGGDFIADLGNIAAVLKKTARIFLGRFFTF